MKKSLENSGFNLRSKFKYLLFCENCVIVFSYGIHMVSNASL